MDRIPVDPLLEYESPKRVRKVKKEARKEAKKEEKQKVKEEKLKQKLEDLKKKEEEKEAKKERDMKKKIEKKIRKKLATPYGDASGIQSVKELSSTVLADYEAESSNFKQLDSFFSDFYSKISKNNQKILSVLEERSIVIKDLQDNNYISKDKHSTIFDALSHLSKIMNLQNDLMSGYYSSFQIPNESTQLKDSSGESKTLRREYYKLLEKFEEIESKIHTANKEKAVSAVTMEKLTEAEQTREIIRNRLKQLGNVMVVQQQQTTTALLQNSLEFIYETMKLAHRTYTDGLCNISQQLEWVNSSENLLKEEKSKLEEDQSEITDKINELGTDKWFQQIIKKKTNIKEKEVSLAKSTVLHIATNEGALDIVKTILDNNPENIDMQDKQGWAPIHISCYRGNTDITKELLNRDATLHILNDNGDTPLHLACSKGNLECVTILAKEQKFRLLDCPNRDGFYPLHLAIKSNNPDIFSKLISTEFETNKISPDGSIMEMIKKSQNEKDYIDILEKYKAAIELRKAKFRTTFHRDSIITLKHKGTEFLDEINNYSDIDSLINDTPRSAIKEWENKTPPKENKLISSVKLDRRKRKGMNFSNTDQWGSLSDSVLPPKEKNKSPLVIPEYKQSKQSKLTKNKHVSNDKIRPTTPLPSPPTDKIRPTTPLPLPPKENKESITTKPKNNGTRNIIIGTSKFCTTNLDLAAKPSALKITIPPTDFKKRKRAKSFTSSPITQLFTDKLGQESLELKKKLINIKYSTEVFEFIVQKRNSKTYQYSRRKLVIFEDKITEYLKNKIHKERTTKNLLQCSRSIKYARKIKLLWRYGKKVEKYLFSTTEQRERFYEAIWVSQHGLQYYPYFKKTKDLKIFIGTWNMGNAPPPMSPDAWLQKKMDYDMYVIGLQECDYPEAKDNNTSVESHLFRWFSSYLGKQYIKLVGMSMWEIRMFIFVKREYYQLISNVKTGNVACGVAGVMANKGCVGVTFRFNETTMGFICCHLAAHQNKIEDRNENYRTIVKGVTPSLRQIYNGNIDITNQVDHLFWIGDLNYRIDLQRDEVIKLIENRNFNLLVKRDQLRREIENNNVFMGFNEEIIVFKPTYKYSIGSENEYSEEKPVRVPAWCDRILWKSLPFDDVSNESYGSCDEITTSDHHPVFATFKVTTYLANLPTQRILGLRIIIKNISIKELRFADNDGIPSPCISFIAPFIESIYKTKISEKTRNPEWDDEIVLIPIITHRDYLIKQSLRVIITDKGKAKDKHKSRAANGCISLANISKLPSQFETHLTSGGYGDCGILTGEIYIEINTNILDGDQQEEISKPEKKFKTKLLRK